MADPRQGGSLSDMAPTGTSIPSDTGTQRTIPSKPNPHQAAPDQSGGTDLAGAADNATDIPRSGRDVGSTGEVVTGEPFVHEAYPASPESFSSTLLPCLA